MLNAFSFVAVLIALIMIAVSYPKKPVNSEPVNLEPASQKSANEAPANGLAPLANARLTGARPSFREFSLLRHEYAILVVLGIAAATSLLGRPYLLLMPAFARTVQHVGPQGLGIMVAASGLGSLLGSLLLASLSSPKRLELLLMITGMGFGLALIIFAVTPTFLFASLVLLGCGAGATMTMMVANTLLQTYAPSAMRGRVMSLYTLIAAGFTQLGSLLISGLGTWIGLERATVVAGVGVMLAVIAGYRWLRPSHK